MNQRIARVGLLVAIVAALLSAACGGGDGGSSAKGSPITVMTIAPVKAQVGTPFENIFEAARVYEASINARGGINGRPLEVVLCDDRGDPNQAAYCARQAVQKKVAAVVGSFSRNQSRIVPVLEEANIAYFGTCCAFTKEDFTSPNSFPLGSQWALYVALGAAAGKYCSNIGVVNVDLPGFKDVLENLWESALKGYGKTIKSTTYVPPTAADLSPNVAQVTAGTDCIVLGITESQVIPFVGAMKQAGANQRLIGLQGSVDTKACAPHWSLCENAIVTSVFPDMSSPAWATYRAALAKYKAKEGLAYNSLGGLGTWAAYVAFTKIAEKMSGRITAPAFLDAAAGTEHLTMDGLVPPVNFKDEWGVEEFARMFNRTVTFTVIENEKFTPLDDRFHDMTPGFSGRRAGF